MRARHPTPFRRRAAASLLAVCTAAAAWPPAALAHGLVAKQDLPIPTWMFAWAAAIVLIVSFVALGTLWPRPRMLEVHAHVVLARLPLALEVLGGAAGIAAFALVVYAGFAGAQTTFANILPTAMFVAFWVAIPIASAVVGDVFRLVNPWRALARGCAWLAGRAAGGRPLPQPVAYPDRLGRWPAVVTILAFAWIELVYVDRDDPSALAVLAVVYAALQLAAMSIWGIERWTDRGDGFAVVFNLYARLAPLDWRGRRLVRRWPLEGIVDMSTGPGTVALVCAMIGTTAFDGFSASGVWTETQPHVQSLFSALGPNMSAEAAGTVAMLAVVALVAGMYRLAIAGVRSLGGRYSARELAGTFAHTLVPIALAYVVAHYFSLLAYNGQWMIYLVSDPLGTGADWLGTAGYQTDYSLLGPNTIWYVQVGALVAGHVAGIVLAHERALTLYRSPRKAARSQYWMLVAMVGFTCLGLWLLSQ